MGFCLSSTCGRNGSLSNNNQQNNMQHISKHYLFAGNLHLITSFPSSISQAIRDTYMRNIFRFLSPACTHSVLRGVSQHLGPVLSSCRGVRRMCRLHVRSAAGHRHQPCKQPGALARGVGARVRPLADCTVRQVGNTGQARGGDCPKFCMS